MDILVDKDYAGYTIVLDPVNGHFQAWPVDSQEKRQDELSILGVTTLDDMTKKLDNRVKAEAHEARVKIDVPVWGLFSRGRMKSTFEWDITSITGVSRTDGNTRGKSKRGFKAHNCDPDYVFLQSSITQEERDEILNLFKTRESIVARLEELKSKSIGVPGKESRQNYLWGGRQTAEKVMEAMLKWKQRIKDATGQEVNVGYEVEEKVEGQ